jgi:hypothetical protein
MGWSKGPKLSDVQQGPDVQLDEDEGLVQAPGDSPPEHGQGRPHPDQRPRRAPYALIVAFLIFIAVVINNIVRAFS